MTSSALKTPKKLIMEEEVSTLVTSRTTVIPKYSRSTSRLTSILERLSDDKPLSSSGGLHRDPTTSLKPPSKASLIIQASRKRDADCQTLVSIEKNLDIEFITRDEISAIQKDREELESLLQTSLNSALKMKEKHDSLAQENGELKEALDILQNENQDLKEQVNELKDMMRELRQLQKEQLMDTAAHRPLTVGTVRRPTKSGGSSVQLLGHSINNIDLDSEDDPHFDDDDEHEHMEKLASMFQKLNDSFEASSSNNHLFEQNASLIKTLQSMKQQSQNIVKLDRDSRSHESKMVEDVRTLAEQAVALLVETEAAQTALKEAYGNVEFAPKHEVDPYKINVKVIEREKRRRRPGASSSNSSTQSENDQVDFLFGSPSHRYPVSPAAKGKVVYDDDDNSLEHRLEEHPDEDHSSEDETDAARKRVQNSTKTIDAIAEEEEAEESGDGDGDGDSADDMEELQQHQRRKLRFDDSQDREETEILASNRGTKLNEDEYEATNEEEEEEEEMTEEEYLYYLQLEKEQQEAELYRQQRNDSEEDD